MLGCVHPLDLISFRNASTRLYNREGHWYGHNGRDSALLMRRCIGGATKALADAVSEGLIVGPRVIQCGRGLSQTGIQMILLTLGR